MKTLLMNLRKNNSGIGVVEIILILVVLIGLVLIFKTQISDIISSAFESITGNTESIFGE